MTARGWPEPCQPYSGHGAVPVSISAIVERLTPLQLQLLVCAYAGAAPASFEGALQRFTSARSHVANSVTGRD